MFLIMVRGRRTAATSTPGTPITALRTANCTCDDALASTETVNYAVVHLYRSALLYSTEPYCQLLCCLLCWPCREIQSHIPEPFWYIAVSYRPDPAAAANDGQQQQQGQPQRKPGQQLHCDFKWARDRLFDQGVAALLYEQCAEEPTATVMQASAAACTLNQYWHVKHTG